MLFLNHVCGDYIILLVAFLLQIKSFRKILVEQKFWMPDRTSLSVVLLAHGYISLARAIGQALVSNKAQNFASQVLRKHAFKI